MSEHNSGFLAADMEEELCLFGEEYGFPMTLTQVRRIGLYTSLEISGGYHKYHPADGTGTS